MRNPVTLVALWLLGVTGLVLWTRTDTPRMIRVEARPDNGTRTTPNEELDAKWRAFYDSEFDRGATVVIGESADVDSLHPLYARFHTGTFAIGLLFDGLTKTFPDFSRGPSLAKSWEFSEDGLELIFHLRDDVVWSDGEPFTAADVKFTYDRQKDPRSRYLSGGYKQHITGCAVIDAHTVKFIYDERSHYQLFDANVGFPIAEHIWKDVAPEDMQGHELASRPVGTGPYVLGKWSPGEYIELVANDRYYGPRPAMERIFVKVIPEIETRVLELENGTIDVLPRGPHSKLEPLASLPHVDAWSLPDRRYFFIGWNLRRPLFAKREVRRALTAGIDRVGMTRKLFGDEADLCRGPTSKLLWGHHPEIDAHDIEYDPAAARAALAKEGWRDTDGDGWLDRRGETFEFRLLANRSNDVKRDTIQYTQLLLRKVGVRVIPELVDDARYIEAFKSGDFDAIVGGWGVSFKMDMTTLWHSDSIGQNNIVGYSNPDVDRLCEEAAAELDIDEAKRAWREAQEIIVRDQPYTFLFAPRQINFVHSRFRNVQMEAAAWFYNIEQWWVPKAQQR